MPIYEILFYLFAAAAAGAALIAIGWCLIVMALSAYFEGRENRIYFEDDSRAEELF